MANFTDLVPLAKSPSCSNFFCSLNQNLPSSILLVVIIVAQALSHVQPCNPMNCSTPGFPALHFWNLLRFMSIEFMMPSNHLTFCLL